MQVLQKNLENGLTVYLSPNSEEPRFYAEIVTRAGSKHDPATNTGLAHYLGTSPVQRHAVIWNRGLCFRGAHPPKISDLYEKRATEQNETRRASIYKQINSLSTRASKLAIPNEMDRVYSDMGAKGLNAHTWHENCLQSRPAIQPPGAMGKDRE